MADDDNVVRDFFARRLAQLKETARELAEDRVKHNEFHENIKEREVLPGQLGQTDQ